MLSRMICESSRRTLAAQVFANDVAPERQRQAGFVFPPFTEVHDLREPVAFIGQLPFMNDEAGVGVARFAPLSKIWSKGTTTCSKSPM